VATTRAVSGGCAQAGSAQVELTAARGPAAAMTRRLGQGLTTPTSTVRVIDHFHCMQSARVPPRPNDPPHLAARARRTTHPRLPPGLR